MAKLPFAPVPAGILAALFPFALYLAFPSHMVFVVGDALDVRQMLAEEGAADPARPDRRAARRVAERIRHAAQAQLETRWRSTAASLGPGGARALALEGARADPAQHPARLARRLPHAREEPPPPAGRNRLHALLRDLDIAFYYLPFGWLGIALARRLRRAPYGYRGLSREERIEREGTFHWQLERRPGPPRG